MLKTSFQKQVVTVSGELSFQAMAAQENALNGAANSAINIGDDSALEGVQELADLFGIELEAGNQLTESPDLDATAS